MFDLIARAARTPVALTPLEELSAQLAGAELPGLVRAALDADEIDAATAFCIIAAMRKVALPASLLERLVPELDSIVCLAVLMCTCRDDELTDLVCRMYRRGGLSLEREALCVFIACTRAPNGTASASLVAPVRRGLRRASTRETVAFLHAAAARLDDPHIKTMLAGVDLAGPTFASLRERLVRTFIENPLSLLPKQPPPKVIQGYTYVRLDQAQSRNELCACGSGKKYKRCCALRRDRADQRVSETGFHLGLLQPGMARRVPRDQFEQFRASELARFAPAELDSMQLVTALRCLQSYGRFEAAESVLAELARRDDRYGKDADGYREDLIEAAMQLGRTDVAERQVAQLSAARALDARLQLRFELSRKSPDALQTLEARARAALAGDVDAWYDVAFALLDHSPALGVLVSRGSFLRDRIFDNETLYDAILDARDELGVEPDEPYVSVLDMLTERSTRATMGPNHDVLARAQSDIRSAQSEELALQQQLREREQAFHELEKRYAALQHEQQVQQASPEELLNTVTKLRVELEEVQGERRAQRARIEELKGTIREGVEQRRMLRKQVAEAIASNAAPSPTIAAAPNEPEARFLEDVAEQLRQPLRRLIISARAHAQLVALPRDVATRALTLCATLAAGRSHAFVGVKKLKRVQDVYAARVDLGHRLLFLLSAEELQVTDVIERRDLELAIERLRA